MESTTSIQAIHRNGNLHVDLHGHFSPEIAAELTHTLSRTYRGKGNIFIHTAALVSIAPESQAAFADHLSLSGLPREHLYLTGIKGLEISPDKGRVIVYEKRKKGCCGRCRDCKCDDKTAR